MKNTALFEDEIFSRHLTGYGHPESPDRFKIAKHSLISNNLMSEKMPLRFASQEDLLLCHTESYLDEVQKNIQECSRLGLIDGSFQLSTGDVQICPESDLVARYAVGAVLEAVDIVMKGDFKNAFCLIRPPGHHACSNIGMGFCIYNNVAIAARYAIQKYNLQRVLIVDWDVHHGNGTQEIFYEDPKVFYFSTHNGRIYPGTGFSKERGMGVGEGYTWNAPIDPYQNPRAKVREAFLQLEQAMKNFQPEFVFISAGFDAHFLDPLGGFNLTSQDFVELTECVKRIADASCGGHIVSVLEGGYNLQALAEVIPMHVQCLNSETQF